MSTMRMKTMIAGLGAVLSIASASAFAAAIGGEHGVGATKGCGTRCVGEATDCTGTVRFLDDFDDAIVVSEAWDEVVTGGGTVRVPAVGNLPIIEIIGNAMCTDDGGICDASTGANCAFPCTLGATGSTVEGLPGLIGDGRVRVASREYVIQESDPSNVSDTINFRWNDVCNSGEFNCPATSLVTPAGSNTIVPDCDDGDPCTRDLCTAGVCSNVAQCETADDCDDGDACTDDICVDGCCDSTPTVCDDGNDCTTDSCDSATGCVYDPECESGADCDDGDECTEDTCENGCCVNTPLCSSASDCDAGDACTTDICTGGCCDTRAVVCDDGDRCTEDSCDSATGCVFTEIDPPPAGCGLACRMTGGGVDTSGEVLRGKDKKTEYLAEGVDQNGNGSVNRYTFGGQAGAPTAEQPQPYGEWTHHQQRGPNGRFVFHAGTASAPDMTEIDLIECSDSGWCVEARPAPAKQIDFEGVGTFNNFDSKGRSALEDAAPGYEFIEGETLHWFSVHVEDLGEPGRAGKVEPPAETCPPMGSAGALADCDCPDFYEINIHAGKSPGSPVVYRVYGYITGGNLQIHPPVGSR